MNDNLKRICFNMSNPVSIWMPLLLLASIHTHTIVASYQPFHESLTEDDCHQVYLKEAVYNQDGYAIRPVVLKVIPDWLIGYHQRAQRDFSSCVKQEYMTKEEYHDLVDERHVVAKARKILRSFLLHVNSYREAAETNGACRQRDNDNKNKNNNNDNDRRYRKNFVATETP